MKKNQRSRLLRPTRRDLKRLLQYLPNQFQRKELSESSLSPKYQSIKTPQRRLLWAQIKILWLSSNDRWQRKIRRTSPSLFKGVWKRLLVMNRPRMKRLSWWSVRRAVVDSLTSRLLKNMKKFVKKSFSPREKFSIQQLFGKLRVKGISSNLLPLLLKYERKSQRRQGRESRRRCRSGSCRVLLSERVSSRAEESSWLQKRRLLLRRQAVWYNADLVAESSTRMWPRDIFLSVKASPSRCLRWTLQKESDLSRMFWS